MVQVHGRRVSKRLHHLQSHVVFIVVFVVWRRARHFVGRRERERMGGTERRLKFRDFNSLSLSFLCCCLLFERKKFVVVESLFGWVLFRSLFVCACDFTSSPGVCDTTLNREINFKQ